MIDRVNIVTKDGRVVDAIAPVIISASRSTDIPAFYAQWFINRLKVGYCIWYNPFNQRPMYVSFQNTKVVVFWTKNPEPMIKFLPELDKRGIHYYFQVTLNDYEQEGFEPHVPSLQHRIGIFKELSDRIGSERIIWRFDPLILTDQMTSRQLLKKIYHVGNYLKGYTHKLVFSFVDVKAYKKVQYNLARETQFFNHMNVLSAELDGDKRLELVEGLVKLREYWKSGGWKLTLATCAETIDLTSYGIEHNRCIDGELMEKIFSDDLELVYFLRTGTLPRTTENLFQTRFAIPSKSRNLKDKGQRKACGCMISKDIGMYNTCRHLCVYCYANTSKDLVMKNANRHNDDSESIIE